MIYLAALAGMDAIVETGSFIAAHAAQDGGPIKFY